MKIQTYIRKIFSSISLVCAIFLIVPTISHANEISSWFGPGSWFDWSDFRGGVGARYFMAKLTSATITKNGIEDDLKASKYQLIQSPEPFHDIWVAFYIDRLGFRFHVEEHSFPGRYSPAPQFGVSELDANNSRFGLDLDIIRYPFLRLGIDYDIQFDQLIFLDRSAPPPSGLPHGTYRSTPAMTLGLHGRALPGRIRGIPVTVQARARFPFPFLSSSGRVQITDWEISGGIRPAIWEMSLYGNTTFSVGLEGGFRAIDMSANAKRDNKGQSESDFPQEIDLKAKWQGAFVQIGIFF